MADRVDTGGARDAGISFVPDGARDGQPTASESAGVRIAGAVADVSRARSTVNADKSSTFAGAAGKSKHTVDAIGAGGATKKVAATGGAGAAGSKAAGEAAKSAGGAADKMADKTGAGPSRGHSRAAGNLSHVTYAKSRLDDAIGDDGSSFEEKSVSNMTDDAKRVANWNRNRRKTRKAKQAEREAKKLSGSTKNAKAAENVTRSGKTSRKGTKQLGKNQSKRNLAKSIATNAQNAARTAKYAAKRTAAAVSSAVSSMVSALVGAFGSAGAIAAGLGVLVIITVLIGAVVFAMMQNNHNLEGMNDTERAVAQYLIDKGMDNMHIAAIMGNMYQESSMNAAMCEGGNYGLSSHIGNRASNMLRYAESKNMSWTDVNIQMDSYWAEYTGEGDAAAFCPKQVRPHRMSGYSSVPGSYCTEDAINRSESGSPYMYYNLIDHDFDEWIADNSSIDQLVYQYCAWFEGAGHPVMSHRVDAANRYYQILCSSSSSGGAIADVAKQICDDNSIGYEYGGSGPSSYDCSGFVWHVLITSGQIPPGTGRFYTSNEQSVLAGLGYTAMANPGPENLQEGDVLLKPGHTAICIGNGQIAEASSNKDGRPGDSSGKEVYYHDYSGGRFPTVLRKTA